MLAQLDAPAMLFTTLALLLFIQDHVRAAAAACVALVLVKETGAIVPVVLGVWLAAERRWRDAAWFVAPFLVLGGWIGVLHAADRLLGGQSRILRDTTCGTRCTRCALLVTFARRVLFLSVANFHWVGAAAVIYAWRTDPDFPQPLVAGRRRP